MLHTSTVLVRVVSVTILLFAFGLSVYRAKTQTIAHDEALTYEWFLDQGVEHVLHYNPANHVLQTLLAKPIVKVLGVSEFTLRLATLFGTAVYLASVYLLCRQLFGEGLVFVLTVAMLALNPLAIDFMAAARGYSLSLAGLTVAMYLFARLTARGELDVRDKEWRWGCSIASASLALSITANFTNIVPAACLAVLFGVEALGGPTALRRFRDRRLMDFAKYFLFPGAATGFCILWPYLIQARLVQSTIHLQSASAALRDIFTASFLYRWSDDLLNDLGAVTPAPGSWQARVTDLGIYLLLPLLFGLALLGVALALRSKGAERSAQIISCRVFAGAAAGSVVMTQVLHLVTKIDYPNSRYCMFLIPLFTIGGTLAAREVSLRWPWSLLKGFGLLVAALIVFDYALSLNTKYFRYNAYDVISLDLFRTLEKDARWRGLTIARVGGTWWYEPEVNFYRLRYRADWLLPYDIKDRSYFWETPNSLVPNDYDYFVFIPASDPGLNGPRVRVIFHDDRTQVTVVAIARR